MVRRYAGSIGANGGSYVGQLSHTEVHAWEVASARAVGQDQCWRW